MPVIDYSKYHRDELRSALSSIDKEKFPENYAALMEALRKWDENPAAAAARFAPPAVSLIKDSDQLIHGKAKATIEYSLVAETDGTLRFDRAFSILPATVTGFLCAAGLIWIYRTDQGGKIFSTIMILAFFLASLYISLGWRRLFLRPQALESVAGIGRWVRTDTVPREDILAVRFDRIDGSEGPDYHLRLITQKEIPLRLDTDKDTLLWLGSEIAAWADVPFYRRHA